MSDIATLQQKRLDKWGEEVETAIFLQALEQITQEINILMHVLGVDDTNLSKTLPKVKKDIGNDYLYMLKELCRIHGKNLLYFNQLMGRFTDEPSEEERARINETAKKLPEKYKDISITFKLIDSVCSMLENEGGGTNARTPGQPGKIL